MSGLNYVIYICKNWMACQWHGVTQEFNAQLVKHINNINDKPDNADLV